MQSYPIRGLPPDLPNDSVLQEYTTPTRTRAARQSRDSCRPLLCSRTHAHTHAYTPIISRTLYKWNCTVYNLSRLAFSAQCNSLERCPGVACFKSLLLSLYCWVSWYMQATVLLTIEVHLGCFCFYYCYYEHLYIGNFVSFCLTGINA